MFNFVFKKFCHKEFTIRQQEPEIQDSEFFDFPYKMPKIEHLPTVEKPTYNCCIGMKLCKSVLINDMMILYKFNIDRIRGTGNTGLSIFAFFVQEHSVSYEKSINWNSCISGSCCLIMNSLWQNFSNVNINKYAKFHLDTTIIRRFFIFLFFMKTMNVQRLVFPVPVVWSKNPSDRIFKIQI